MLLKANELNIFDSSAQWNTNFGGDEEAMAMSSKIVSAVNQILLIHQFWLSSKKK
jgi:hypothetical protein